MTRHLSATDRERQNARRHRAWDKQAERYDKQIGWFERHVLGPDNRAWAAGRATGETLEVAIGTGLNLPFYPPDIRLAGIDLSPEMLAIATKRAVDIGRDVDLREGDAQHLPFGEDSFDSVVCTYSLCNIPDIDRAVAEMKRVLRPGGRLILVDHIRSEAKPVLWIQRLLELVSLRVEGDYMTRRPLDQVRAHGFEVEHADRFKWGGIVERVQARKPT